MISIPVHDEQGNPVGQLELDEKLLGGELRPALLKQAYVRFHANRRLGTSATRNRSQVEGSTKKLYRQKGTGNARRGDRKTNILRGGGHAHAKRPRSWRQDMPHKMRKLANKNALLAKALDNEIKLIDKFSFDKPNTKKFAKLLETLKIDRTCLVALPSTVGHEARSAQNLAHVSVKLVDHLNVFDLLNHRYLVADKMALEAWIKRGSTKASGEVQ